MLVFISALLFTLSFPVTCHNYSLWPIIFFALTPLFTALDRSSDTLSLLKTGMAWGLLVALATSYFLFYAIVGHYGASLTSALIFMIAGVMLPYASLFSLFAVLYGILKRESAFFYLLAVPSLWVLTEFSREIIPIMVPWGSAGYALQPCLVLTQAADITGIYGLSFFIVMVNSFFNMIIAKSGIAGSSKSRTHAEIILMLKQVGKNRRAFTAMILICTGMVTYGFVRLSMVHDDIQRSMAEGFEVSIVQSNFDQKERWNDSGFIERINICMGMSGTCGCSEGKRIIVWPETVLNSPKQMTKQLFSYIRSGIGEEALLIAGGLRSGPLDGEAYNSAYVIPHDPDASIGFYDKNILLPYAETVICANFLGQYYSAPSEFLRGSSPPAVETRYGRAGISICFEAIYPWHIRKSVLQGAGYLVNISNDGWFGSTAEPVLHLHQASLRAIENRRYMVRASNNGYSAIISPTGEVAAVSGLYTRECIRGTIAAMRNTTIYAYFGDWIIYLACAIIVAALVVNIFRRSGTKTVPSGPPTPRTSSCNQDIYKRRLS